MNSVTFLKCDSSVRTMISQDKLIACLIVEFMHELFGMLSQVGSLK